MEGRGEENDLVVQRLIEKERFTATDSGQL